MDEDKQLAAQRLFFEQLNQVRRELADDSRQMRKELIDAFQRAHDENKERMDAIAKALTDHIKEYDGYVERSSKRFDELSGIARMITYSFLGGATVIGVLWAVFQFVFPFLKQ